jgi:hypothetical protein
MPLIGWPCCHARPVRGDNETVPIVRVNIAMRKKGVPIILATFSFLGIAPCRW